LPRISPSVADQLRAAIREAEKRGITRYRIAKEAGLPHSTVSEFCNHPERQVRLDIAEKLARAIGARILFKAS